MFHCESMSHGGKGGGIYGMRTSEEQRDPYSNVLLAWLNTPTRNILCTSKEHLCKLL